ncbi:MAG: hypothetical protein ABR980_04145 [Ignavibacteriaceae bacterium]|jgi:hypothetical protein
MTKRILLFVLAGFVIFQNNIFSQSDSIKVILSGFIEVNTLLQKAKLRQLQSLVTQSNNQVTFSLRSYLESGAPPDVDQITINNKTKEAIKDASVQLYDKFSFGALFSTLADQMAVVDSTEVVTITQTSSWLDKVLTYSSIGASLFGSGFLFSENKQNASIGAILATLLTGGESVLSSIENKEKDKNISDSINSALNFVQRRAEKLAIQDYLKSENKSVSITMNSLESQIKDIEAAAGAAATTDDIVNVSVKFVNTLKDIDNFYSMTLTRLRSDIRQKETSPIFTKETQDDMESIVSGIDNAIKRAQDSRYTNSIAELVANDYVSSFITK